MIRHCPKLLLRDAQPHGGAHAFRDVSISRASVVGEED